MDHQTKNIPQFNSDNAIWRYQVTATLKNAESVIPYLEWLFHGHVQEVCKWASNAEVVQIMNDDESQYQVKSIYWFNSITDFEQYEHEGAPQLRSEGINFAKSIGGVDFERQLGWAWLVRGEG